MFSRLFLPIVILLSQSFFAIVYAQGMFIFHENEIDSIYMNLNKSEYINSLFDLIGESSTFIMQKQSHKIDCVFIMNLNLGIDTIGCYHFIPNMDSHRPFKVLLLLKGKPYYYVEELIDYQDSVTRDELRSVFKKPEVFDYLIGRDTILKTYDYGYIKEYSIYQKRFFHDITYLLGHEHPDRIYTVFQLPFIIYTISGNRYLCDCRERSLLKPYIKYKWEEAISKESIIAQISRVGDYHNLDTPYYLWPILVGF